MSEKAYKCFNYVIDIHTLEYSRAANGIKI